MGRGNERPSVVAEYYALAMTQRGRLGLLPPLC